MLVLPMVFRLDCCSFDYAHTLKAFGYIERVIKPDFFFGKDLFYFICEQHVLSYHLL